MSLEALYKSYGHEFQPNPVENTNQNVEPIPENPEHTLGERLWQGAQSLAEFGGGIADLVISGPAEQQVQGDLERHKILNREHSEINPVNIQEAMKGASTPIGNTKFEQKGTNLVNKLAGRDVTPGENDTTGKIIKTGAPFLVPGPAGFTKLASGIKPAAKWLAKEFLGGLGASTALHATPRIAEEGGFGGTVEDLAKMIVGSKASELPGKSRDMAKKILQSAKSGSYKNIPAKAAGKVLSYGAKPDAEFSELAKKHKVTVPYNVEAGKRGKFQGLLANTYLKSAFVADKYKDMLENASESMIDAVKRSINKLGAGTLQPNAASVKFAEGVKEYTRSSNLEADGLFKYAFSHLSKKDRIKPKNTFESLKYVYDIIKEADIYAPSLVQAARITGDLLRRWGKLPKKITAEDIEKNPRLLLPYLKNLNAGSGKGLIVKDADIKNIISSQNKSGSSYKNREPKDVRVRTLAKTRSQIGEILDYGENIEGGNKHLKKIYDSITKDIDQYSKPDFSEAWDIARKFKNERVHEIVGTDLARSLMRRERPEQAFNMLDDVSDIKALKKMIGYETENGKKIFDSLAKAKITEIVDKATSGGLEGGEIRSKAFSDIFTKNQGNIEVLQELAGPVIYKELEELGKVSKRFSDAGQVLFNTSGTAPAAADIAKGEKIAKTVLKYVLNGGILAAGNSIAGPLGALGSAAIPNIISRIVVNKNVIGEMKRYALAREAGKVKQAETIGNRLIRMVSKEVKALEYEAKHKVSGEKEEKK